MSKLTPTLVIIALMISCNKDEPIEFGLFQTFDDPVGDVNQDFVDIKSCTVDLTTDQIIIILEINNIPASLTFNSATLGINFLEYQYGVEFDTNNDGVPNFSISLSHFKFSGSVEIQGDLISNVQSNLWEHQATSNQSVGNATVSLLNSVLTITTPKSLDSQLNSIRTPHVIRIYTFHNDGVTLTQDDVDL